MTAREARDLRRAWRRGRLPGPGLLPEVQHLSQMAGTSVEAIYAVRDEAALERLATARDMLAAQGQVTR